MAESAAAAPSSGPAGKGNSSSGAWWKSLASRKKHKEAPGAPRPPPPPDPSEPPPFAPSSPADSLETQQQPGLGSGSSRRNLKVSRSGRFKEKRKVRAPLLAQSPQQSPFEGGGGGSSAPSGEPETTPCP